MLGDNLKLKIVEENLVLEIYPLQFITYIIEESKLISENMSPNVIHC
jgi:hypothetical protein